MLFEGEKYINPFTDFGFKKLFGEEPNKDLLLDFLNELLKDDRGIIKDLTYKKTERLDDYPDGRKVFFDLYCETETGEKFIVEMQNNWQQFYKDRVLFYATYPIRGQYTEENQGADWNYNLKPIYVVSVVNFILDQSKIEAETPPGLAFRRDVMLMDKATHTIFYDKLTLIFLEMPHFTKTMDQLETRFDKWMYILKNMNRLNRVPESLREKTFEKFFALAEIARLTDDERNQYERGLKNILDMNAVIQSSRVLGQMEGEQIGIEKGRAEGEQIGIEKGWVEGKQIGIEKGKAEGQLEGKIETARNLRAMGLKDEEIVRATGLTIDEIRKNI